MLFGLTNQRLPLNVRHVVELKKSETIDSKTVYSDNLPVKILDVGCGTNKYEGAIGLDINPRTGADVIHDLGVFPYPFEDNEFELIVSRHVIEHVPDVLGFVDELYRIAAPGARIEIVAPHYTNPDWASDPTHRNHLNSYTFTSFVPERTVYDFYTETKLRPLKTYASLANLWKAYLALSFL